MTTGNSGAQAVHAEPADAGGVSHQAGPVVYLHIGAPKTGTTYLQDVLWRNRHALAEAGLLYPGRRADEHFHAALDLRQVRFLGYDNPQTPGAWERVAAEARSWRGSTVVISHEMLAWATEKQARRAVASLHPATVHIVYTARDVARQIPAVWQEAVKNRRVVPFRRFLRSLYTPEKPAHWGRMFWRSQDATDALRRWGAAVPATRIHVVTVPPPGAQPDLLWTRFAGVTGIDAYGYDAAARGSNASLGAAEVELLRRINRALGKNLGGGEYERLFKRGLAEGVLARRSDSAKVTLPRAWHAWATEQADHIVAALGQSEYDIVGDLDDLRLSQPADDYPEAPDRPDPRAILRVAVETIVRLTLDQDNSDRSMSSDWRTWFRATGRAKRLGRLLPHRPRDERRSS